MSVITISRGSFSGGKMLAESVAEELGYRCLDRDELVEKAAMAGVTEHELRVALEKAPTFLERFTHKRYIYMAVIQAALTEEVRHGKIVYQGHAGHLLLKGGGPVFRVRIIAPMEFRISMAQQRLGLGRREVIAYIRKVDEERKKWAQYLYGVDWGDPSMYDLVVNLENVDLDRACDIVLTTVKRQKCFEFDGPCQAAMDNLARASRVKANIALDPITRDLEVDVVADGGDLRIIGKISMLDQVEEIQRVAREVEGVTKVNLEELMPATIA